MAKTTALSIKALEKQCSALEAKIIQTQHKKITQLEKSIIKNKSAIATLKTKLLKAKTTASLAKTPAKKKASQQKKSTLKASIADKTYELKALKTALSEAKITYKNKLSLQKAKVEAAKIAAMPKRKKRVLGPKIKAKKINKHTAVPAGFLQIDTDTPVAAPPEPQTIATEYTTAEAVIDTPPAAPIIDGPNRGDEQVSDKQETLGFNPFKAGE